MSDGELETAEQDRRARRFDGGAETYQAPDPVGSLT